MRTRQYAVQALLGDGSVFTGRCLSTRNAAEESAARLVALNGALCWIAERERVELVTISPWRPWGAE